MHLIAHRGNLRGPIPELENSPAYIEAAIAEGLDVEVDIWRRDARWFLGHDEPQYGVTETWLEEHRRELWLHCKNLGALQLLVHKPWAHAFWHENDAFTLTTHGYIWTSPNREAGVCSVLVDLGYRPSEALSSLAPGLYAICTDYPLA